MFEKEKRRDLEKEIREIFDQFIKEKKPSRAMHEYANKLIAVELKYQKEGLSFEEMQKVREAIVRGR